MIAPYPVMKKQLATRSVPEKPMTKILWQPPRLRHAEEEGDRRATWLELFYDLIFVAAIAQLSNYLETHISWLGLLEFVTLFVPLWWCWIGATFYASRFDTDDLSDRLFAVLQMGIIAAMAVNMHHGLTHTTGFALCYIAFHSVLIGQYLNAGFHIPAVRPLSKAYAIGFGCSAILWLASLLFPPPWRFILWAVGLVIEFATPIACRQFVIRVPPSATHLPERMGLFTIIVLGEAIVAVVSGLSGQQWSWASTIIAFLGLATAVSLWWLYFDTADGSPLHGMHEGRFNAAVIWLYAHLPLAIGLVVLGVGVERMVIRNVESLPTDAERYLVCGAVALCLTALAAIHLLRCTIGTAQLRATLSAYRLGSAALAMTIAGFGGELSALTVVAVVSLGCAFQVAIDLARGVKFGQ